MEVLRFEEAKKRALASATEAWQPLAWYREESNNFDYDQVRTALNRLLADGALEKSQRGAGRFRRVLYRLAVQAPS